MNWVNRDQVILKLVQGKSVLHLGCIGFTDLLPSERLKQSKNSLHYKISAVSDVVGVDYCKELIELYNNLEIYENVLYGDVTKLDELPLNKEFDIILAGDIIEHISNPGKMLEGIKRFCGHNTLVVISTPHAFGLLNFLRFLFRRFTDGNEHVMTFNMDNISNLLKRHGYLIDEINTCFHKESARAHPILFYPGKMFFSLFPRLGGTLLIFARLQSE